MNKKFLFSFLGMLFVGLVLGYGFNALSTKGSASELLSQDKSSLSRRFGDKMIPNQTAQKAVKKSKELLLNKDDSYFLELSKMDSEEILGEINRILQKSESLFTMAPFDQLALSFLYSRLGQKAPHQALEQIKQKSEYRFYLDHIIKGWAERNPEAAMNYCLEQKDTKGAYGPAELIARISPEKALEWVKELPSSKKNEAVYGLLSGVFQSHPEKIGEIMEKAGTLVSFDAILTNFVAEQWVSVDKEAAMKWISSLPEQQQIGVRARALSELPLEEATLAMASLDGKAKEAVIIQIGNALCDDSPREALEWLMEHSDSDIKSWQNIIDSAYSLNTHFKNPDLQEYLTHLPAGEKKDILMEKMVDILKYAQSDLSEKDMNDALSFASQISNEEKRETAIDDSLFFWVHDSPADARQWIEKSDLSPEKKKDWYKRCDRYAQREEEYRRQGFMHTSGEDGM